MGESLLNAGAGPTLLLTASQAAKALQIGERSLWRLTADGKIPVVKIGRSVRYRLADLQGYIDHHTLQAKGA